MAVAVDQGHGSNIHKSFSTPCLSDYSPAKANRHIDSSIEILVGHSAPRTHGLVVEVAMAMASGIILEPASSGLVGAYFLRAQNGDTIAVAKPEEEGLAGRMFGQPGIKSSIQMGETGVRESAAYILDHGGFAGVPPTVLVKFSHPKFNPNNSNTAYKVASLQRYVNHDSDAGDLGPSNFSVSSVHRIGILDIRLMNLDRHAGNILVRHGAGGYAGGSAELVPIDHGFCLPDSLDDPYFEWLHWPQASISFSEAEVDYISSLDPFKDAELLRAEVPSIGEYSIRILVICTIFLKQAMAYGLRLADIGQMMTREFQGGDENRSTLENLCINAKARMKKALMRGDLDDNQEVEDNKDDLNQVWEIPEIPKNFPTKGNPFKNPRFSSTAKLDNAFTTLLDTCINIDDHGDDNPKAGNSLTRSVSYSATSQIHGGQRISFGEMEDEEWCLFLESFQKLLPQALEERKSLRLLKHRLVYSCEF